MIGGHLVGPPSTCVERCQGFPGTTFVRVQRREPEPDERIVRELSMEFLELCHSGGCVPRERQSRAQEISGLRLVRELADDGAEQIHRLRRSVCLEIVSAEGQGAREREGPRMNSFELLYGARQVSAFG